MSEPQKKSGSFLMKLLKIVLLLIVVAVAAFFAVGYLVLDGKYEVSREITIKAGPAAVHKQVGDLREWPNWLPFTKHDTSVKVTIDKPTGAGASQNWTGKSGDGKLMFLASDEETGVEYTMVIDEKYTSRGAFLYAKSGDETRVTWRMTGQNEDIMGKWMALAMPTMVGPMFEEGLADLKSKVEAKK
jgi:hypothetical protein